MPRLPALSRSDPLRNLRAFAQVARLGSVSRAAEALGISQPAVTLQLQALAREHGVVLLERSGRRLVPTPAGEALLALARPLVDGIDGLGAALQARLEARSPDALSIAAGGVALRRLLPRVVDAWTGPPLRIGHAGGIAALDQLRDGSIALAVGSWLDVPGDIDFEPLLHSPAPSAAPGIRWRHANSRRWPISPVTAWWCRPVAARRASWSTWRMAAPACRGWSRARPATGTA